MSRIKRLGDPNLIYGQGIGDDTGVYKLREDLAIVQSIDMLTPIVDDPYMFGRIAAANSFSDIYAVAATPLTALNLICYPCGLGMDIIAEILKGGAEAVAETGAVLLGGHSMQDREPKYGLAATGTVSPAKMITNANARPGDAVILTKKIGTGILNKVMKSPSGGASIPESVHREAEKDMARLNRSASEAMARRGASACTDVTGFGLLGHAGNIATASNVRLVINYSAVPVYDGVKDIAASCVTGGCERNMDGARRTLAVEEGVPEEAVIVTCDPQTSGGLLITIAEKEARRLLESLRDGGDEASAVIGHVEEGPAGTLLLRP